MAWTDTNPSHPDSVMYKPRQEMPINEHPEYEKFVKLTDWMYEENADVTKLRLRFYNDHTHRVNAGCDIKKGD